MLPVAACGQNTLDTLHGLLDTLISDKHVKTKAGKKVVNDAKALLGTLMKGGSVSTNSVVDKENANPNAQPINISVNKNLSMDSDISKGSSKVSKKSVMGKTSTKPPLTVTSRSTRITRNNKNSSVLSVSRTSIPGFEIAIDEEFQETLATDKVVEKKTRAKRSANDVQSSDKALLDADEPVNVTSRSRGTTRRGNDSLVASINTSRGSGSMSSMTSDSGYERESTSTVNINTTCGRNSSISMAAFDPLESSASDSFVKDSNASPSQEPARKRNGRTFSPVSHLGSGGVTSRRPKADSTESAVLSIDGVSPMSVIKARGSGSVSNSAPEWTLEDADLVWVSSPALGRESDSCAALTSSDNDNNLVLEQSPSSSSGDNTVILERSLSDESEADTIEMDATRSSIGSVSTVIHDENEGDSKDTAPINVPSSEISSKAAFSPASCRLLSTDNVQKFNNIANKNTGGRVLGASNTLLNSSTLDTSTDSIESLKMTPAKPKKGRKLGLIAKLKNTGSTSNSTGAAVKVPQITIPSKNKKQMVIREEKQLVDDDDDDKAVSFKANRNNSNGDNDEEEEDQVVIKSKTIQQSHRTRPSRNKNAHSDSDDDVEVKMKRVRPRVMRDNVLPALLASIQSNGPMHSHACFSPSKAQECLSSDTLYKSWADIYVRNSKEVSKCVNKVQKQYLNRACLLYLDMACNYESMSTDVAEWQPGDLFCVALMAFGLYQLEENRVVDSTDMNNNEEGTVEYHDSLLTDLVEILAPTIRNGVNSGNITSLSGGCSDSSRRSRSSDKSVHFAGDDGSCVSPPNDRKPISWLNMYENSHRFHDILKKLSVWQQVVFSYREEGKALLQALLSTSHFLTSGDVRDITSFFSSIRADGNDSSGSSSRARSGSRKGRSNSDKIGLILKCNESAAWSLLIHDEITRNIQKHWIGLYGLEVLNTSSNIDLEGEDNVADSGDSLVVSVMQSIANESELQSRSSWMLGSVIRYIIRWIFDPPPHNVSRGGVGGNAVTPHSRSQVHTRLAFASTSNERLYALCGLGSEEVSRVAETIASRKQARSMLTPLKGIGPSQTVDSDSSTSTSPGSSPTGTEPQEILPFTLECDACELTCSANVALALKQLSKVHTVRDLVLLENCDEDVELEKFVESVLRSEDLDAEEVSDVIQTVLAAEYARQFLLNLCLETQDVLQSLYVPFLSSAEGPTLAWSIVSECADMLWNISNQFNSHGNNEVSSDMAEHYMLVLRTDFSAFISRLQSPLLSVATIHQCQTRFSQLLQAMNEGNNVTVKTAEYYQSLHFGVVFDFPEVQLLE